MDTLRRCEMVPGGAKVRPQLMSGWYREPPKESLALSTFQISLHKCRGQGKPDLIWHCDLQHEDDSPFGDRDEKPSKNNPPAQALVDLQEFWESHKTILKDELARKTLYGRFKSFYKSREKLKWVRESIRRALWPDLTAEEQEIIGEYKAYEAVLNDIAKNFPRSWMGYLAATWRDAPTECQILQVLGRTEIHCTNPLHKSWRQGPNPQVLKVINWLRLVIDILVFNSYTGPFLLDLIIFLAIPLCWLLFDWKLMPMAPYADCARQLYWTYMGFNFARSTFCICIPVEILDWVFIVTSVIRFLCD